MKRVERREEFSAREREYQLERPDGGGDVENPTGNFAHHFSQSSQRKKVQVSSIEDATLSRIEMAEEEAETNDPIRDVGRGDDDLARIFQGREGPAQYRHGIAEMLQDVREEDVIEDPAIREGKGFDIGAMKDVVVSAGLFCTRRIALDSRDDVALLLQDLPQIAISTADVENAERFFFLVKLSQNPVVAAVLEILKGVAALRISMR